MYLGVTIFSPQSSCLMKMASDSLNYINNVVITIFLTSCGSVISNTSVVNMHKIIVAEELYFVFSKKICIFVREK